MLIIDCPFCGPRDEREFEYCGPYRERRPDNMDNLSESDFIDYLLVPENPEGVGQEFWWHKRGCGEWLLVVRDTRTHQILSTVEADAE